VVTPVGYLYREQCTAAENPKMAKRKTERPQRPDGDRRLRQATRHARTLKVLQLLQSRGRYTIKDLAAEVECTERTIYRDLAVLELAGVPWYHDEKDKCYRVRPDFRFPVVNLTDDELLGQAMATAITSVAGLNVMAGAGPTTKKLAASTSEERAKLLADAEQLVAVLNLKLADHRKSQEVIKAIQWALLQEKQLTGLYASPYQDKPSKLTLHPYRLVLAQQAWYLIAQPSDEAAPKSYRVARFKSLRMLDTPAKIPAGFDLNAYFGNAWGVYRGSESFDVEILFLPAAAAIVTETVWHKTQAVKQNKDGSVRLSFIVDGLEEILWWVLGWSGNAKVLGPEKLRRMVVDQLQAALKLQSE